MKKMLILLFVAGFLVACATKQPAGEAVNEETTETTTQVQETNEAVQEEMQCDLGAKSGGVTMATEEECRDLGGRPVN